jgi:hypothetical protein
MISLCLLNNSQIETGGGVIGAGYDCAFNGVIAEFFSCFLCTIYNLSQHEQHTKVYIVQRPHSLGFQIIRTVDRLLAIYSHIATWEAGNVLQKV